MLIRCNIHGFRFESTKEKCPQCEHEGLQYDQSTVSTALSSHPMMVWIMCRFKELEGKTVMEFMGVFSDEKKAEVACTKRGDWIFPMVMDERLPVQTLPWPENARYPMGE